MMLEEALTKLEAAAKLDCMDPRWEALQVEVNDQDFSGLDQDQFVRFLEATQELSWDIPSALSAVCEHGSDDSEEIPFFMHRPAWQVVTENGRGPDGLYPIRYEENNNFWEVTDNHFKEVHGLDLKDKRINWEFDT